MFSLSFSTTNAAFDIPTYESAALLRDVAASLNKGNTSGPCVDANGNTVGAWSLTSDDEAD